MLSKFVAFLKHHNVFDEYCDSIMSERPKSPVSIGIKHLIGGLFGWSDANLSLGTHIDWNSLDELWGDVHEYTTERCYFRDRRSFVIALKANVSTKKRLMNSIKHFKG